MINLSKCCDVNIRTDVLTIAMLFICWDTGINEGNDKYLLFHAFHALVSLSLSWIMEEDTEYLKLPIEDRCVHKVISIVALDYISSWKPN